MRTFIAIELDDSIRQRLGRIREISGIRDRAFRWVKHASIHLTLKFLGEIEPEIVPEVNGAMERAVIGVTPFVIEVGGMGCFPGLRNPRVLWVAVDAREDTLLPLQSSLEAELDGIGFKREKRIFKPHLTLARIRGRIGSFDLDEAGAFGDLGAQEVTAITLFQSELKPSGAVYVPLATVPFQS